MFNIISDSLIKILEKGKIHGYLERLGNFANKNIISLNFANDTLLFLKTDSKMVEALKLLL
jgi:hypothetical protein